MIAKNKKELFTILKEYMEIDGISRYEDDVVEKLKSRTANNGFEYQRGGMGSLIMRKKGNGPKILIMAHMDEVGYVVKDILDNGQLRVFCVGGIWPSVVIGTKATLISGNGKKYQGIFGHTSIHILGAVKAKEAMKTEDMFVDFGFKNKKEAEELNIEPGNRIYMSAESFIMHNEDLVVGKAMDNRAGVTALDQIAQHVSNMKIDADIYLVGSVQEEVGSRGAKNVVSLIKPDVAFALDTCPSHDTHGAKKGIQKLGKGAALTMADSGTMMDPKLIDFIFKLGKEKNIPVYKYVAQGGGTDAEQIQYAQGGVATSCISIPQRYLHSPHGMASLTDIQASIDLLVEFIKNFTTEELNKITYK